MKRHFSWVVAWALAPPGLAGDLAGGKDGALEIVPLAENVWMHTSYKEIPGYGWFPSNGLIVVEGDKAVLVDTAWPEAGTPQLLAWLDERGYHLEYVLATHSHDDRTSGFSFLNEKGVATYASAHTNTLLAARGESQARYNFEDGLPGSLQVDVFYPGPGHAPDNHVVWLPAAGILFGGCLVRAAAATNLGNVADAVLPAWAASAERVRETFPDAKVVVPGHGAPGDVKLLGHTAALARQAAMNTNQGSAR